MSEVLRELVVSLSLNSDNFSRNVKTLNNQIKEVESNFNLAGAGVENFSNTHKGAQAKVTMLQGKLQNQKAMVTQYQGALSAANEKLRLSSQHYNDYSNRLAAAKTKQSALTESVRQAQSSLAQNRSQATQASAAYAQLSTQLGEDARATQTAKANMEYWNQQVTASEQNLNQLQSELDETSEGVEQLTGQVESEQKAMQSAADGVSKAKTNLNNAEAAVRETEAELKKMQDPLENLTNSLNKFSTTVTPVGTTLSKCVTAPLIAMGTAALTASVQFESSMTTVRKTVKATEEQYGEITDAINAMAIATGTSSTEIAAVVATAGQLGIATDNIMDFTQTMVDLSNAAVDLEANSAAESVAKFANITGMDPSQYRNFGSAVVELGNNYATTESNILEFAMRMAAAGSQVGMSEADILGFATTLSSVGLEAQAGGTAFSKVIVQMETAVATGNSSLKDFADVAGMTTEEFSALWEVSPTEALKAFIAGLAQMDDEGISAIATLQDIGITEIRLRDTLLRTVNANELMDSALNTANTAWEENTSLTQMAQARYATTANRLTALKESATQLARSFGDLMLPTLQSVVTAATDFITNLNEMDEGSRQTVINLGLVAAAAGPVLVALGKLASSISTLITAGKAIATFLGGASIVSGAGLVAGAIAGGAAVIVGSLALLSASTMNLREKLKTIKISVDESSKTGIANAINEGIQAANTEYTITVGIKEDMSEGQEMLDDAG